MTPPDAPVRVVIPENLPRAFAGDEIRARLLRVPVDDIRAWLAGEPRRVVNPEVLARRLG